MEEARVCILAASTPQCLGTETAVGISSSPLGSRRKTNQRIKSKQLSTQHPQRSACEGEREAAQLHTCLPQLTRKERVWPYILTAVVDLHQVAFIVDLPSLFGIETGFVQHHATLLASDHLVHKHLFPTQSKHGSHCTLKHCSTDADIEGDKSVTPVIHMYSHV